VGTAVRRDTRMSERLRLLVVDDRKQDIELLARTIESIAHEAEVVLTATSGTEAIERVTGVPFDVAVLDYKMPEMDGLELASRLKVSHPACTVVILTAYGDNQEHIRSHPAVDHYLDKMSIDTIDELLADIAADRNGTAKPKKRVGLFRRG
jgi:putative two-component system response regulator